MKTIMSSLKSIICDLRSRMVEFTIFMVFLYQLDLLQVIISPLIDKRGWLKAFPAVCRIKTKQKSSTTRSSLCKEKTLLPPLPAFLRRPSLFACRPNAVTDRALKKTISIFTSLSLPPSQFSCRTEFWTVLSLPPDLSPFPIWQVLWKTGWKRMEAW